MENSFMTHQDDSEDYSVVHAKTPLTGFFLQQRWKKRSPAQPRPGKYLCWSHFLTVSITGYCDSKPVTLLSGVESKKPTVLMS